MAAMPPDDSKLVEMALVALEEVAALCHVRQVERSRALAVVLAFLASRGQGDRHPYDLFWRSVDKVRPHDRWGHVNSALIGIYIAAGRKRDLAVVSLYEKRARGASEAASE